MVILPLLLPTHRWTPHEDQDSHQTPHWGLLTLEPPPPQVSLTRALGLSQHQSRLIKRHLAWGPTATVPGPGLYLQVQ